MRMILRSAVPARQSLLWMRPGGQPTVTGGVWRRAGGADRWELFAELPAMARPLLADPSSGALINPFFSSDGERRITHVLGGVVIESEVAGVEAADAEVRRAVEIAFWLRRVNG
jgi:hypothetical protein